ncbi:MAG: hypothetical protein Q4F05_09825 [bacterium]|nr:hypothetical protein [bacterium]
MNRLFMAEGIPGSGKTTFARKLTEQIKNSNSEVTLYTEGDLHPTDMAWCAFLTKEEFQTLCILHPDLTGQLEENKKEWNDHIILAYTKIPNLDSQLFSYLESKEIYDGRVDTETFCELNKDRFKQFGTTATGITIFECALLQNSINELLLFHNMKEEELTVYIQSLLKGVAMQNPIIIYLDVDVKSAIERAARERIDENGNFAWENRIIEYISSSPYGVKNGLHGIKGLYEYFETRKQLELSILEHLPVKQYRIQFDLNNQEEAVRDAIVKLCNTY